MQHAARPAVSCRVVTRESVVHNLRLLYCKHQLISRRSGYVGHDEDAKELTDSVDLLGGHSIRQ